MAQLYSFSSLRVPPAIAHGLRLRPRDPQIHKLGRIDGPEAPLAVEFGGISEEQQRAALAAFPGGKRFHLVQTHHNG